MFIKLIKISFEKVFTFSLFNKCAGERFFLDFYYFRNGHLSSWTKTILVIEGEYIQLDFSKIQIKIYKQEITCCGSSWRTLVPSFYFFLHFQN